MSSRMPACSGIPTAVKHVVSYVMNLHVSVFQLSLQRHCALRNPKTLQNMKYYNLGKLQKAQTSLQSIIGIMMLSNVGTVYLFSMCFLH